jgi:hypothetical protein
VFIRGRHILNPVLIINECFDSRLRYEEPGVICKMDLERAYDHVNWGFFVVYDEKVHVSGGNGAL